MTEELEEQINEQVENVGTILESLFKHADDKQALWLKAKDCRTLATWIIDLQNIATLYEKQLEQAAQAIVELEAASPKKKLWRPGPV